MQLLVSSAIQSFGLHYKKIFNAESYTSFDKPTIFVGMYKHNDLKNLEKHRGKKIIIFGGSDTMKKENLLSIKKMNDYRDMFFVCRGPWMQKDLDDIGIEYNVIDTPCCDTNMFRPCELGESLYWYGGHEKKYGKKYIKVIKEAIPDLDIIVTDHKRAIPHNEMPEIYKKCFAGVRAVEHDAFSQSVHEMALMGRRTIYNNRTTFTESYEDINDIIRLIKEMRGGYNYRLVAKRHWAYYVENWTKWTNFILKNFGTEELDCCNIFEDSRGRCGSIFRIQRKSDIENMEHLLGYGQMERPYYQEQMDKLNKQTLITTKISGVVATEFKNTDAKKGYFNNNFNTHDRGTKTS